MRDLEEIGRKKVIFFTPNGFLPQRHAAKDDLQEHLSGWESGEMERHGYHVIGLLGPKCLRGECHVLKRRPAVLCGLVSLLAQILSTHHHPDKAAAILCVKTLPDACLRSQEARKSKLTQVGRRALTKAMRRSRDKPVEPSGLGRLKGFTLIFTTGGSRSTQFFPATAKIAVDSKPHPPL